MKFLKYFILLFLIAVIGISIYTAVQPNVYKLSRSRTIKAPISVLFNKVNDFKSWPSFSPWIEKDTEAILTYGNITSGDSASYSWNGEILGEGKMQIISAVINKSIQQKIEFIKPFEAESDINWTFETTKEETKVTWSMEGQQNFITKLFTLLSGSIESTTGPDFERGLFKLDSITQVDINSYAIRNEGVIEHSSGYYLYNSTSCKFSDFEANLKAMMPKVGAYALTNNITMAGKPFVLFHKRDKANDAVIFSCCIPTTSKIVSQESSILTGQLLPFKAVKTVLKGKYKYLDEAWEKSMEYISAEDLVETINGPVLETYITTPESNPNPADWITEIYIAVD